MNREWLAFRQKGFWLITLPEGSVLLNAVVTVSQS